MYKAMQTQLLVGHKESILSDGTHVVTAIITHQNPEDLKDCQVKISVPGEIGRQVKVVGPIRKDKWRNIQLGFSPETRGTKQITLEVSGKFEKTPDLGYVKVVFPFKVEGVEEDTQSFDPKEWYGKWEFYSEAIKGVVGPISSDFTIDNNGLIFWDGISRKKYAKDVNIQPSSIRTVHNYFDRKMEYYLRKSGNRLDGHMNFYIDGQYKGRAKVTGKKVR
jgi:hypothetical protein